MPTNNAPTTPRHIPKSDTQSATRRRSTGLSAFVAIVASIVFLLILFTRVYEYTPLQSIWMTSYLDKKYGQDFAVQNVRLEGAGFGVEGEIDADAYPKSDPSLKFIIGKPGGDWWKNVYSRDTFLEALWSKQADATVNAFLKKELPNADGHIVIVQPTRKLQDDINGYTPSFSEVQQKYAREFSYSLSVRSTVNNLSSEPSSGQLERAFRVVNFAKSMNSITPEAYYLYKDTSFNKVDQAGQARYEYSFGVDRNDIQNVTSPNDLRQYFEIISNKQK